MVLEEITLPYLFSTAIAHSIKLCTIGVLLLLFGVLLKNAKENARLVIIAFVYILSVYLVYVLSGLGLLWFQPFLIKIGAATYIGITIGLLVGLMGIIEIKGALWQNLRISLPAFPQIQQIFLKFGSTITAVTAIILGALVSMVEQPCSGGPYLAITIVLSKAFDLKAFFYLLVFDFIFLIPLIMLSVVAYVIARFVSGNRLKPETVKLIYLVIGLIMLALGTYLVYSYASGGVL